MPVAAPKPCTYPGCGVLVRDGSSRCEQHKRAERKQFERYRGSARKRGYTWAWEKASKAFLAKPENVLCRSCLKRGEYTASAVVDHIIPHKGNMALFWDRSNWQGLCKCCHDRKTATEDGGFGRTVKNNM